MIFKILVALLVLLAMYLLFFKTGRGDEQQISSKKKRRDKRASSPDEEVMLECHKCGTFISNKEAIIGTKGEYFCSRECLQA